MPAQSLRAQMIERRTYLRPVENPDGSVSDALETPNQAADRQIAHRRYLWEEARKKVHGHLLAEALHIERALGRSTRGRPSAKRIAARARVGELREAYAKAWPLGEAEEAELGELRRLIEAHVVSLSGRITK